MRALLLAFLVLLSGISFGQTDGRGSLLSAAQLAKLRKSRLHVLVPTWLPAGFKVQTMSLERGPTAQEDYLITKYVNPRTKAELTIQYASEGIGDVFFTDQTGETYEGTGTLACKSPVFGKVVLEICRTKKVDQIHLNWVELNQKRLPRFLALMGDRVKPADGKRVIENLRYLK